MGDWNNDGKVDFMDYHIYSNYIDKGASGGRSSYNHKSSGGSGFLTVLIIALVLGAFNELIGAVILLGYIFYCLVS